MNAPAKVIVLAALACGVGAVAPGAASAMPVANIGIDLAPITQDVHAVRVCNRWGRCWWSAGSHYHGRYGYRAPYYGYRYGWRHPHRYGYGWRGHGGWHGGHGHWR